MPEFKVIICGSRDFTDYELLKSKCDLLLSKKIEDGYKLKVFNRKDDKDEGSRGGDSGYTPSSSSGRDSSSDSGSAGSLSVQYRTDLHDADGVFRRLCTGLYRGQELCAVGTAQ